MYLNPATLLNNIRVRYYKDKIYVSNHLMLINFIIMVEIHEVDCYLYINNCIFYRRMLPTF
jgi:hypothetical protein